MGHPAYERVRYAVPIGARRDPGVHPSVYMVLDMILDRLAGERGLAGGRLWEQLSAGIHVCPDLAGNRSPLQDPRPLGAVLGMGLEDDEASLALLYLAALQGVALSVGEILSALATSGVDRPRAVVVTGGLARSARFCQVLASACGVVVLRPRTTDCVLLGTAMCAMAASGHAPSLSAARTSMAPEADPVVPADDAKVVAMYRAKATLLRAVLAAQRAAYDAVGIPP